MSVSSVAVVGCGPKGLGVVMAFAQAGLPVTAVQVTPGAGTAARKRLDRTLTLRVDAGEMEAERAKAIIGQVKFAKSLTAVRGCDLVIESTVGDVRSRRALMATLEGSISRGAILAANAAPALLAQMSEVLLRPDQFVGLRFFHPATHTPLVEVTPLPDTAPGVVVMCEQVVRWLAKTPVEHVDGPVTPVVG